MEKSLVNDYFEGLLADLSINSRNSTQIDHCTSIDLTARGNDAATNEWEQLESLFYVQNKVLTTDYLPNYQANSDIIRLWDECLRPILGLERVYSLSESADDYSMYVWNGISVVDKMLYFQEIQPIFQLVHYGNYLNRYES